MPRVLISDVNGVRTYNVSDDTGKLIRVETETDVDQPQANRAEIRAQASAALGKNLVFLNLATPTNAQVVAQVRLLTKECNALIRDMLEDYSRADDV
jgi:hypothetical protein